MCFEDRLAISNNTDNCPKITDKENPDTKTPNTFAARPIFHWVPSPGRI